MLLLLLLSGYETELTVKKYITLNDHLFHTVHPILIMEYLSCGDLLGYLRKSRGIADKYYHGEGEVAQLRTYDLVSFSKQIATAMGFLASRGVSK